MKYTLPLLAALALVGAGCASSTPAPTAVAPTPTPTTNTAPAPTPDTFANSISAQNQKAGPAVVINAAILSKPGYVVIHADAENKPGMILGHSNLLPAGGSANVSVPVATESGKYYWAMLHTDNGDSAYDAATDGPSMDTGNNVVMMRFMATSETMEGGKVMAPTTKSTDDSPEVEDAK